MSGDNTKKALAQEKRITRKLKDIGLEAKRQMASGSLWFAKSDVITNVFQIEAKTKREPSKSFTIKLEWIEKIENEAFMAGKIPALVISFGDNNDYFVVRDRYFLELMEELIRLRLREGNTYKN